MLRSFPAGLAPPEPLIALFDWLESNGHVRRLPDGTPYAVMDRDAANCCVTIQPVDPDYAVAWLGEDRPDLAARLAAFMRTGGDGSFAGLWLDDEGAIRIVHQGSGSGSTLLCVLVDDPVDLLRLLAIGYEELCWPEDFDQTPEQLWQERRMGPDAPPVVPCALRRWVERTFAVAIPRTASQVVRSIAGMDDDTADDPFWRWIRQAQAERP